MNLYRDKLKMRVASKILSSVNSFDNSLLDFHRNINKWTTAFTAFSLDYKSDVSESSSLMENTFIPSSHDINVTSLILFTLFSLSAASIVFWIINSVPAPIQNRSDKSFIFDDSNTNNSCANKAEDLPISFTPLYILKSILGGLIMLPPETELLKSTTKTRARVYQSYRSIPFDWQTTANLLSTPMNGLFQNVASCSVDRLVRENMNEYSDTIRHGTFRMYKFQLLSHDIDEISNALKIFIASLLNSDDPLVSKGIMVSNAGGFHSITDCFSNGQNTLLGEFCSKAVNIVESDDMFEATNKNVDLLNTVYKSKIRVFDPYDESEAWVNRNQHGHWNSLHTHTGSVWSGIYYVQIAAHTHRGFTGKLLIKPSPHSAESKELTAEEMYRLNINDGSSIPQIDRQISSCCDYMEFSPEAGTLLIFPGYLQHAVLPLSVVEAYRSSDEGSRISFAFNFVEASSI